VPADIAEVLAATGAPDVVLRRLLHDFRPCAAGGRITVTATDLRERLMPFATAAALLGGPQRATQILSRDTRIMLFDPVALQAKLGEGLGFRTLT
jgi:hypothetical protein